MSRVDREMEMPNPFEVLFGGMAESNEFDKRIEKQVFYNEEEAHAHLDKLLKLQPGDKVFFILDGQKVKCTFWEWDGKQAGVRYLDKEDGQITVAGLSPNAVRLYQ